MTDAGPGSPQIAVLIPCYNEAGTIAAVVRGFRAALPQARIHVYDNNSTDGTALQAMLAGAAVTRERRQGKGNVVRRMFADIEADIYLMADGDGTYSPDDAEDLIRTLMTEGADMVVGTRRNVHADAGRNGHAFGNRLTDDNAPQPDYVQQNVILIDYASQTPLGTGAFSAFTVSTAPGPFAVNPSPSPLAPSALAPTGAGPEHGGFDTCTVSNGYAWLTFYLSCDGSFSSANGTLAIGAKITPNGRDAIYDSRDGTIRQSATVTVTDGHSYGASSIELTGAQLNPGIDNGPQTIVGSEAPENCWRLYNYKLRLSAAGNTVLQACGARLYQWRFANAADRMALWNTDSALQYAFATQRFGGLYGLKAYFWPMNVRDETGALTGTSKQTAFTLQADGCTPRPINFDNANDLYISLYCTFGGIRPDPAVSRSVNFVFYDQFGNSGRCRLQTLLPLAYSANDLLGFRFLLDGNGGVLAAPVPRPANPPVSILGTPVLIQGSSVVHGPAAALGQMHNDGDFPTLYGTDIAVLQNGIDWSLDPQNADEATYSEAYYYAIAGNGNYLQAIPKPNYPIPYSSAASKAEFWYFKPIWSKSAVVVTDSNGNAWSGINIKGSKSASSGYPALTTTLLKAGYTSIADTMTFTLK